MKQMLGGGGGGGGEEGRGPSAVLSLFVSCSLSRLFWQANASKLPSILFSADPELLKVKHMCFGLSSWYCTTHSTVFKSILVKDVKEQIAFSQEEEGPRMPLTSCLLDILNSAYRWASLLWEDFSNLSDNLVGKKNGWLSRGRKLWVDAANINIWTKFVLSIHQEEPGSKSYSKSDHKKHKVTKKVNWKLLKKWLVKSKHI